MEGSNFVEVEHGECSALWEDMRELGYDILNASIESSIESNSIFALPFTVIFANVLIGVAALGSSEQVEVEEQNLALVLRPGYIMKILCTKKSRLV